MALLPYAQQRLRSFLAEIGRAAESDFPYPDSENALKRLQTLFEGKLEQLEGFVPDSNPDVVAQQCRIALRDLFNYLPLVGFILRSTTVRNSFEAFGPFLRLAGDILEGETAERKTQLVLSSEWDYSPFIYNRVAHLEHFLFIGVPAPESGNPLLVPLAGHELGHAVWMRDDLRTMLQATVRDYVVKAIEAHWTEYQTIFPSIKIEPAELTTTIFAVDSWRLASEWCLSQAEETFCDFLGLAIFGESYLYAFGYILCPGLGARSECYPEMKVRVAHLVTVAERFAVKVPDDFEALFEADPIPSVSAEDLFRIRMADVAMEHLIDDLATRAESVASRLTKRSDAEVERILVRIKLLVPAEECANIADIFNAAWLAYNDTTLWENYPSIRQRKTEVLKELVLKNLEVYEIERIQNG